MASATATTMDVVATVLAMETKAAGSNGGDKLRGAKTPMATKTPKEGSGGNAMRCQTWMMVGGEWAGGVV